jgi:hypothetical protein
MEQHQQQPYWVSVADLEGLLEQECCNIEASDSDEILTVTLRELLGVDGFLAILNGRVADHWRQCPVHEINRGELDQKKDQFVKHVDGNVYALMPLEHICDVVNDNGLEHETEDGMNSWYVNSRLEDYVNRNYDLDNDRSLAMLRVINRIMRYQTDTHPWGLNIVYFCWQDIERFYNGFRSVIDPSLPSLEDETKRMLLDPAEQFLEVVRALPIPEDNKNSHMFPNLGGPQCLAVIDLKPLNIQ